MSGFTPTAHTRALRKGFVSLKVSFFSCKVLTDEKKTDNQTPAVKNQTYWTHDSRKWRLC